MKNIIKTIAYSITILAIFAVVIFSVPQTTNAWDEVFDDPYGSSWDSGYGGGWDEVFDDPYDSSWNSGWDGGWDSGYNDYCDDCYSDYGSNWNDYCNDCYSDYGGGNYNNYSQPAYVAPTYNNAWAESTSWNTTNVTNTNRNISTVEIDFGASAGTYVPPTNNNTSLSATCYPNRSVVDEDETVTWYVNANGGNGNYSYVWSGTDGLSSNGSSVSKSYNNRGTKYASVLVTSGNRSVTATCGTVLVENDNDNDDDDEDFDVTCRARPSRVDEGETVRWEAEVDGVDEDDVDFRWSGDADGDDQEVTERYSRSGTYEARVRATYRGQTETDECTVRVDDEDSDNGNVTLISNPAPTGNLASLNSVYLSQVPYTGAADNFKLAGIVTLFGLLSAWAAYEIVANKAKKDRKSAIANFKSENLSNKI